jgi:glycosyltransferase involved in cell wall biosynthesis
MKILMLGCLKNNNGNRYGGAEKSLIHLANWLASKGIEIVLASVEGDVKAFSVAKNVKFVGYKVDSGLSKIRKHLKIRKNTIEVINEERPDLVIGFWIYPLFYGVNVMKRNKIPYIYSLRNDPSREYSLIAKYVMRFVINNAAHVVFQTKDAASYFGECIKNKSSVIHNPTYIKDGDYTSAIKSNKIVTIGRLEKQKNQKILIDAFCRIKDQLKNTSLEIYGEGSLKGYLESYINERGISDSVKLMGTYPDVLKRIQGAKLFVLPSLYEGMPNVLIEAMCIGVPVLSSDCPCGGPREIIKDGDNGFLFKNNDIDDLVNKMMKILKQENNDRIIENAKKMIETHSEEVIFSKWEKIIKKLR